MLRAGISLLLIMTLLTGLAYPLFVTGLAQWILPSQANGSLIEQEGKLLGSTLIGQSFQGKQYFWGRPSATTPNPYNGGSSSGSNFGPTNPAYLEMVEKRVADLRAANPDANGPIPADLVTASGSGLDPHISLQAALYQVPRIAKENHLTQEQVTELIKKMLEPRALGILGEPRINVLLLNMALKKLRESYD